MIFLVSARKSFPARRSRHFRSEIVSCSALAAFPLGIHFLLGARCISARKSFSAWRSPHFRMEIISCSALVAFPFGNHFLLGARLISAKLAESPPDCFSFVSFFIVFLWFCIFLWPRKLRTIHFRFRKEFCFDCKCTENRQPHIALPKKLTKFLQNFRFPLPFWKKCTVFAPFHRAFFPFR